jgi:outer membrane protein assembly factor BamB
MKLISSNWSRPVVYENNIYTVDVDGNLYSVDSASGKVNWQKKAGGPLLFKSELTISDKKRIVDSLFSKKPTVIGCSIQRKE